MYFHFFLLMPHLFSSLFREISCKSCPYPPSSFSSFKSTTIRLGRDHRDVLLTPSVSCHCPLDPSLYPSMLRDAFTSSHSGFSSYFLDQFLLGLLHQPLFFSHSKWWTLPGFSTLLFSNYTYSLEDLNQSHDFKPYIYTDDSKILSPLGISLLHSILGNQPRAHYV